MDECEMARTYKSYSEHVLYAYLTPCLTNWALSLSRAVQIQHRTILSFIQPYKIWTYTFFSADLKPFLLLKGWLVVGGLVRSPILLDATYVYYQMHHPTERRFCQNGYSWIIESYQLNDMWHLFRFSWIQSDSVRFNNSIGWSILKLDNGSRDRIKIIGNNQFESVRWHDFILQNMKQIEFSNLHN